MDTWTSTMLNQSSLNDTKISMLLAANQELYSVNSPLFARLSILAKQPKWIIFTEQATLPTVSELRCFNIETKKVIKMKSSQTMSETDVIMKVLTVNTASAIVTGDSFSKEERIAIELKAKETACEVFFMTQDMQKTLMRNIH